MKKWVRLVSIMALLAIMVVSVGCNSKKSAENGSVASTPANSEESSSYPSFAVVTPDRFGDRGFGDMSIEGIEKAAKEFNIKHKVFSCNNDTSIFLSTLKSAAENYDVIFLLPGYALEVELKEVMAMYPDKTYIYVDGVSSHENVKSITFSQNEGAFLAGVLAAHLTADTSVDMVDDKKVVGFVGGGDMPVIRDYQTGFEQGVKYADPSVEVIVKYAGDHFNPALGKVTAFNTYKEGADVIFQAAGITGLGVLEAASTYKFICIGVDTDQGYMQPGFVPSSMLKRVDTAFYDTITKICKGEKLEDIAVYNVANGGISLAENEYYDSMVSDEIKGKVAEAAKKIINGELTVNKYQ